ncbi:MAG: ATP-dependent DNA ligase [Candidatus Pacearchaeota archaeon]
MLYRNLVEFYEKAGSTTKRLEKVDLLSKFLKNLDEKDKDVLYLLMGNIYPDYDERKIGISDKLAIKAISKVSGRDEKDIIQEWKKIGDLGEVTEHLLISKKQSTLNRDSLTTERVLETLRKLPEIQGKGAIEKKIFLIVELLSLASPLEAKYLIRTIIGDLRIGLKESTIRDALASTFFVSDKESKEIIQSALDKSNDLAYVFEISKMGKLNEFKRVEIKPGRPIKVMLAQKVRTISEAFKSVGKPCAIEYKYDGFRMIIHKDKDVITLFTRRLEDVTKQFPEVVEYVKKYVKGESFILDSEAIGFNKMTKEYRPFQEISQRIKRKYEIEKLQEELPVEINVFDILYYNGKSLIDEPFRKRAELVRKIISTHPYKITPSKQIITSDEKEAKEFYKKAIKDHQEGIMFKNLNAGYQPGSRVGHMLKLKQEERDLDLVITGGEYGTGKRKGWLSSFILSCIDKNGKFLEVGKVGTGIKEKGESGISFEELTEKLRPYIIEEEGRSIKIKPKIVVSVTYQEIQRSPKYNSGFALRFPRFTAIRPDKNPEDINSLDDIIKNFEAQKSKKIKVY